MAGGEEWGWAPRWGPAGLLAHHILVEGAPALGRPPGRQAVAA